jgi:hypothetical protein
MSQTQLLDRMADLLDREHDAIATVDIDALTAIQREREAQLSELAPITAADLDAFTRVETRRARNERAAQAALSRLGGALGRVGRGRTALAGYRPNAGAGTQSRALDKEV